MQARTIAKGKCYACNADVCVAEVVGPLPPAALVFKPKEDSGQIVLHAGIECTTFLRSDPDAFARQCNLEPADEISESLDSIFK